MQSLEIRIVQTGEVLPITEARALFGRDDAATVVASGPRAGLASGRHAELAFSQGNGWTLADLGSVNGTYLNGKRLTGPERVKDGDRFSLALNGPAYVVVLPVSAKTIVDRGSDPDATLLIDEQGKVQTLLDREALAAEAPAATPRPPDDRFQLVLRRARGGEEVRANGRVLVLGRDPDCDVPLRTDQDKIISSRHAEIRFDEAGQATLADLGSRNGTWLDHRELTKPTPIQPGDHITLGRDGPEFVVEQLGTARAKAEPRPSGAPAVKPQVPAGAAPPAAASARKLRPSLAVMMADARRAAAAHGGGATMFAAALAEQMGSRTTRRLRWIVGISAVVVVAVSATAYVLATRSVREATRAAAEARDALAAQIEEAGRLRERSDAEIRRLTQQIASAQQARISVRTRDSLVRRVDSLRTRSAALATNLAVVRGLDLAAIVRANLPFLAAVRQGEVTASAYFLTADGYLLTSSEIGPGQKSGEVADTVFVHPGGREMRPLVAQIVAREGAFTVLKVGGYGGDKPSGMRWSPGAVRAGRAVAVLGFVRGVGADSSTRIWVPVRLGAAVLAADSGGAIAQGVGQAPPLGAPAFDGTGALVGVVAGVRGGDSPTIGISLLHRLSVVLPAEVLRRLGVGL